MYNAQVNFIRNMLQSYSISPRYTLVGAVMNGKTPLLRMRFGDAVNYKTTISLLENARNQGDGNDLDVAFQIARTRMFSEENGARANTPKVLVVFVNDKVSGSLKDLGQEAKALRQDGVKIILVGYGENVDPSEVQDLVDIWFFPDTLPEMSLLLYPVIMATYAGKFKLNHSISMIVFLKLRPI